MPLLTGTHVQAVSGRAFHYRVTFELVVDAEAFFACAINEPTRGPFGRLERGATFSGTVPSGPDCVPVELAIRSRVMSYIEGTDFGEWKPPPPSWPGVNHPARD